MRAFYDREHSQGRTSCGPDGAELQRRLDILTGRLRKRDARVLDVGTGPGTFVRAARLRGLRAVGCELSFAAFARRPGPFPAFVGSLDAVRREPRFDAVCFWDVLEHLAQPLDTLRKAHKLLTPHGIVAVSMPNHRSTARALQGWRWPYYEFASHGHLLHLSLRQVHILLRRVGLRPVYWETRGSADLRAAAFVRRLRPQPAAAWIADGLSGLLARVAVRFGFGNTLVVLAARSGDADR